MHGIPSAAGACSNAVCDSLACPCALPCPCALEQRWSRVRATPSQPSPSNPPHRRLLREEVTSGRLEAAESKAEVLGELVDRVRFEDGERCVSFYQSFELALAVDWVLGELVDRVRFDDGEQGCCFRCSI